MPYWRKLTRERALLLRLTGLSTVRVVVVDMVLQFLPAVMCRMRVSWVASSRLTSPLMRPSEIV